MVSEGWEFYTLDINGKPHQIYIELSEFFKSIYLTNFR